MGPEVGVRGDVSEGSADGKSKQRVRRGGQMLRMREESMIY